MSVGLVAELTASYHSGCADGSAVGPAGLYILHHTGTQTAESLANSSVKIGKSYREYRNFLRLLIFILLLLS